MQENDLIFNHPHRDKHNGDIVIPLQVVNTHAGPHVEYKKLCEEMTNLMELSIWTNNCKLITFDSKEGG